MRRIALALVLAGLAAEDAFAQQEPTPPAPVAFDPTPYVDPFIGTGGHGHTFPGATVPFGMVQLSPDTRLTGWDGCSGYHHDDEFVYGFSHTHLSGTGCSDYGDILLMPGVGDFHWNNGSDGTPGYRKHFSHANETATAGYYSVLLDDSGVKAELTATTRVGVHRYTFPPDATSGRVLIDLAHRDDVIWSGLSVDRGRAEVTGFRRSSAWARDQLVCFVARFSKPFASFVVAENDGAEPKLAVHGRDVKAWFGFDVADGEPLVVTVGISSVDLDGARRNLDAECPGFDFDAVRDAARETWRKQLGKIEVHGGTDAQLRTFYTALYHCCIAPNVFSDVDGRYRGRDGQIHEANGWTQYTVFSLWDTFRALHPLMTILEPARTNDWINTFLAQSREGGALPVWELAGNETDCMIGYHAVPVIADAYAKGIRGYDANAALDAMVASANRDVRGLPAYREQGFVPSEVEGESVSKTLEYAYDDWCIAEMARAKGWSLSEDFRQRGQSWKNLLDPQIGFFRPRRNNAWIEPFDPAEVNFHLTEANSWQYSLFVPHDLDCLTAMLGGRERLVGRLDALFSAPSSTTGREQADITGLIGQYAHGNEPSHHLAYLYDHAGQPWKTQERVRQVLDTLYSDRPDGLCGNEDCGQMSAWYVFSALGFYPVCPGRPEYAIGAPLFPEARIHLDDGATFTVRANGAGPYVREAMLDGAPLMAPVLPHEAVVAGGGLFFVMAPTPSSWGSSVPPRTVDADRGQGIVAVPYVERGERVFDGWQEVALAAASEPAVLARMNANGTFTPLFESVQIQYSTDGGATFQLYRKPLRIDATTEFVFYGESRRLLGQSQSDLVRSKRATARFVKRPHHWALTLAHPYAPQYAATGDGALVDGLRGGADWRTADWQGFQGVDVDATVDLGVVRDVGVVRVGFIRDVGSWIWLPTKVQVSVSADGATFRDAGTMTTEVDEHEAGTQAIYYEFAPKTSARFVRVVGVNRGVCPAWHPGAGHRAWLFADEIEIEAAK